MDKKKRWITTPLFVAYSLFIVWYTLITRESAETGSIDLRFMWTYRELIAGSPTGKEDVLQNIKNIIFFISFGFLYLSKK